MMSTFTAVLLLIHKRARPADVAAPLNLSAAVKRGLGMLAALSLATGPAAAQASDAMAAPIDIGRMALAFGVLSAIALLKIWSYADKRGKLMDRLTGYLTSRAAHHAHHASTSGQPHDGAGAAKAESLGSTQQRQRSPTDIQTTKAPSQVFVSRGARPASGFRVLPVPGLPSHLQYLSD